MPRADLSIKQKGFSWISHLGVCQGTYKTISKETFWSVSQGEVYVRVEDESKDKGTMQRQVSTLFLRHIPYILWLVQCRTIACICTLVNDDQYCVINSLKMNIFLIPFLWYIQTWSYSQDKKTVKKRDKIRVREHVNNNQPQRQSYAINTLSL